MLPSLPRSTARSSAAMRLRSRAGVRGSCQTAGKSVASRRIPCGGPRRGPRHRPDVGGRSGPGRRRGRGASGSSRLRGYRRPSGWQDPRVSTAGAPGSRERMTARTGCWRCTPGGGALRRLGRAGPFHGPFPIHSLMLAMLSHSRGIPARTSWPCPGCRGADGQARSRSP